MHAKQVTFKYIYLSLLFSFILLIIYSFFLSCFISTFSLTASRALAPALLIVSLSLASSTGMSAMRCSYAQTAFCSELRAQRMKPSLTMLKRGIRREIPKQSKITEKRNRSRIMRCRFSSARRGFLERSSSSASRVGSKSRMVFESKGPSEAF